MGEERGDSVRADLAAYGLGDVTIDGEEVGRGIPVEVIASREAAYGLSLEVGSDAMPIRGGGPEQVSAVWFVRWIRCSAGLRVSCSR